MTNETLDPKFLELCYNLAESGNLQVVIERTQALKAHVAEVVDKAVKAESARGAALMVEKLRHNPPALTVWEGAMPESNGRSNFTAVLKRKDSSIFEGGEHCIARSEYPGRVKYEADCVRYLIGELAERPDILAYDADAHSGYVLRDHEYFVSLYDLGKLVGNGLTQEQYDDIVRALKGQP